METMQATVVSGMNLKCTPWAQPYNIKNQAVLCASITRIPLNLTDELFKTPPVGELRAATLLRIKDFIAVHYCYASQAARWGAEDVVDHGRVLESAVHA